MKKRLNSSGIILPKINSVILNHLLKFNESSDEGDKLYKKLEDLGIFIDTHKIEDVSSKDRSYFSTQHLPHITFIKMCKWKEHNILNVNTNKYSMGLIKFEDDWWVIYINSYTIFLCDTKEGVIDFLNTSNTPRIVSSRINRSDYL